MTIGVQVFQSGDQGASTVSATSAGDRISKIFDPVLVNGYNSLSVSSITRSGSTVTVTTGSAHGIPTSGVYSWAYLTIAGATQTDYNGTWKCTATGTTTLTFDIGGLTPTTPATGTITIKRAPLGWTKAFSGTNKAAYLSPDGKCYLRVDDTSTTTGCTCRLYRTMSDVDTGTDPTPTVAQAASGVFWNFTSASGIPWFVTGKDNAINFWSGFNNTAGFATGQWMAVGKCVDLRASGDDFAYFIRAGVATGARVDASIFHALNIAANSTYLMRSYTAAAGAVTSNVIAPKGIASAQAMGTSGATVPTYPHPPDSTLLYDYADVGEPSAVVYRGRFPGVRCPLGNLTAAAATYDTVDGTGVDAGKTFVILKHATGSCILFEVTDSSDW